MTSCISDVKAIVRRAAEEAGFDLSGIAPATDAPELEHFPAWIAAGHAGEMKYLEARNDSGDLKRASLATVAPWARSVVVCAINYNTEHPYSTQVHDSDRGWISRYAWSREDYHDAVLRRLKQVEAALRSEVPVDQQASLITRSYVDTGPIVERVFAKYSGVGWIGKNTCAYQSEKRLVAFSGRDPYLARTRRRLARARSLRHLHALHRRLPDGCDSRALPTRFQQVHFVSHD